MLPFELVYEIRDFLPWRHRCIMVSREWLRGGLKKRIWIRKWRSKRLSYSYIQVFGSGFVNTTWYLFCRDVLGLSQRIRNKHYCLSWRAAADNYFNTNRCEGCGKKTHSNVFGVYICDICKNKRRLINCHMVKVWRAKQLGIPRRIIKTVQGLVSLAFLERPTTSLLSNMHHEDRNIISALIVLYLFKISAFKYSWCNMACHIPICCPLIFKI